MKWYGQAGNWYPNPAAHPGGFREVGDAARDSGMRFSLWLEPERGVWDDELPQQHPDWYHGEPGPGNNLLLNLGHPEARRWAVGFVSSMVREWGLGVYRQDFNFEPLEYWRSADAPDRQGMTETLHIQGLYAFWDELLRRHPGLIIDNCASGGHRLDIELTRRSVPFWRSDYQCSASFDPLGAQLHTAGLAPWLPITGTAIGLRDGDTYNLRSGPCALFGFAAISAEIVGEPVSYDWAWRKTRLAEYHRTRPFYSGDYYPLTRFSPDRDVWYAYQLHRPDLNAGLALAFRRDECPYPAADLSLCGLDTDRQYRMEDADTGEVSIRSGTELASGGLALSVDEPRGSRLNFYEAV